MQAENQVGSLGFCVRFALLATAFELLACSDSQASKSWSALATCTLGKAAQGTAAERSQQLRLIQLSHPYDAGKPNAWPERCAKYANQLYAAIDNSGTTATLQRGLHNRLGCGSDKPSCVLNNETVVTLVTEVWDAAKTAELKFEPQAAVAAPEITAKPLLTVADWKPLLQEKGQVIGPQITADGRVQLLVKKSGERMRPWGCEFSAGLSQAQCFSANQKVPAFPPQSIQWVDDAKEFYGAGLTEGGLSAFNLRTGDASDARGMPGNVLHEGLAIERGEGDKGFAVVLLAKGKAGKAIDLAVKNESSQPLSLGNQIAWVEPAEGGAALIVKSLKGKKLVDDATLKGSFSGAFHTCRREGLLALATWAGHSGQHGAKPSAGSDKTQFTITMFHNGTWSKPAEAQLPFKRVIESELVCTGSAASMAWVDVVDGGAQVGQLTCAADGCKTAQTKLAGVESRWWWAVGPVGNKLLLMWRGNLGEARLRLAPIAELDQAKDVLLFDDQDHGGPKAGEAAAALTGDAALLLFKDESPVALVISPDGTPRVITAK